VRELYVRLVLDVLHYWPTPVGASLLRVLWLVSLLRRLLRRSAFLLPVPW
jgi:hypothetical protein